MTALTLSLMFYSATVQFNLPQDLLPSLCAVESGLKPNKIHLDDGGSNSLGICQVKLATAQWLGFEGDERDLMQPSINIYYAAKYLAYQLQRYNGYAERAIVAYNRGNAIGLTRSEYSVKVLKQWGRL